MAWHGYVLVQKIETMDGRHDGTLMGKTAGGGSTNYLPSKEGVPMPADQNFAQ